MRIAIHQNEESITKEVAMSPEMYSCKSTTGNSSVDEPKLSDARKANKFTTLLSSNRLEMGKEL